ncbi:hypothetical protein ACFSTC_48140 [Nonomuraea ferruginea]
MTQRPDDPNHDPENDGTPDRSVRPDDPAPDDKGAEIVDLDAARSGRNADRSPSEPKPTTDDADGPVLEGEVLRVDRPGPARTDWRASLERKATSRQPLIPLWLRSRAEAIETVRWASLHYVHVARLPGPARPAVCRTAHRPGSARPGPPRERHRAVDLRP